MIKVIVIYRFIISQQFFIYGAPGSELCASIEIEVMRAWAERYGSPVARFLSHEQQLFSTFHSA